MDFYIEEIFEFKYNQYGLLRLHSDETFARFVSVMPKAHGYDWMSLSETEEVRIQNHYEKQKNQKR